MSGMQATLLRVTDPQVPQRRIGFSRTCSVLMPPVHLVREPCGQPTTHVRLAPFTDGTTRWLGVCPAHTEGPLA